MTIAEHQLVIPYVGKPAVLDANLLLFYWCTEFDQSLIGKFKRIETFEVEDAVLLLELLALFPSLWTTPHILTEVSNLSNSLASWIREAWFDFFADRVKLLPEIYASASEIVQDETAIQFGLTDAALIKIAATHVILTVDWPLTSLIQSRGQSVINFNNLREAFLYS